jgi:ubiquinone/menaquinone biosynthesis C-methylase UbiE
MAKRRTTKAERAESEYRAIASFYDAEYEHLDYLRQDVPFLMEHIRKTGGRKGKRVLELAVGTGRAAIPLAQDGSTVLGVDYDPEVLAIARRKRDFVGLSEKQLKLVKGDARKFRSKDGQGRFDWCIILFNTLLAFTTLDEIDAVLETAWWHLKRGGRLWVDVFNPDLTMLAEARSYGLDPVTFHVPELDRTVSRVTDVEDVRPQVRRVTFIYRWFENGEEVEETRSFEMTWMMPRELVMHLERHGFEPEAMYGDFEGGEVTAQSSRIMVCGRKKS